MRKIIFMLMCAALLAGSCVCAFGAETATRVGIVAPAGLSEEEFNVLAGGAWKWTVFGPEHEKNEYVKFYDDLPTMLMALNAGEISEIETPKAVGEYIVNNNPAYKISCAMRSPRASFAFGFLKSNGTMMQKQFNYALGTMRADGTLDKLANEYFSNPGRDDYEPVNFETFKSAQTIKVAVTGDMPPIDYIAADGTPAGYNTAVLAELGRRLGVNVETVNINTASKTSALVSGRVDAVFWYIVLDDVETQADISDGVIASDPYYDWDMFVHIRKR